MVDESYLGSDKFISWIAFSYFVWGLYGIIFPYLVVAVLRTPHFHHHDGHDDSRCSAGASHSVLRVVIRPTSRRLPQLLVTLTLTQATVRIYTEKYRPYKMYSQGTAGWTRETRTL